MPQGYLLELTVNGARVQFQNVTITFGGDNLDVSSSLNEDLSYNAGFSEMEGDLTNCTIEIDTLIVDPIVQAFMLALYPKDTYLTIIYTASYGSRHVTGTGLFVDDAVWTFNIPGGAHLRMRLMSLQTGFTIS